MAENGVIAKNDDLLSTEYRYRITDLYYVLEAMGRVFEYTLEHPDFKVLQAHWHTLYEAKKFTFRVVTSDDQITEAFEFHITDMELKTKEALLMMMETFRRQIINWWENRRKMIARLLGTGNGMCEFYPKASQRHDCICAAGSDISGSTIHFPMDPGPEWQQYTCSAEYSKTCQWAIEARKTLKGFWG